MSYGQTAAEWYRARPHLLERLPDGSERRTRDLSDGEIGTLWARAWDSCDGEMLAVLRHEKERRGMK